MNLLIIADEPSLYNSLQDFLLKNNHSVFFCGKHEDIVSHIWDKDIEIVIMDLIQEELQDFKLLKLVKNFDPILEVIIVSESTSPHKIFESIRLGTSEYITKPLKIDRIQSILKRINEKTILRRETFLLAKELNSKFFFHGMVGKNPSMLDIFSFMEKIAGYSTPILITGEAGTGKEMAARAVHQLSLRSKKKFVICDCTSIPEGLFESKLHGYVRRAFTDADKTKTGLFDEAHEGTLFFDEIGNLPLPIHSGLLRVLEEGQFRRPGSPENIQVDVRVIAATNRDLGAAVKNKSFREDLFSKLSICDIHLPSLKKRPEDISLLSDNFLLKYNKKLNKAIGGISRRVQKILLNYEWPGNIRELENVVKHSVSLCRKTFIDIEDLPEYLQATVSIEKEGGPAESAGFLTLEELERQHIMKVMGTTHGNIQKCAQILGISPDTLSRKLKEINFPA